MVSEDRDGLPAGVRDGATFEASGLSKAFGATQALVDVSFRLAPGSVEALIGENGAGKSTLIKVLAGVHRPDAGGLAWSGQPFALTAPADARGAGIAVVHQDTQWVDGLSVLDNLFLGRADFSAGRGWVTPARLQARAEAVFQTYDYSVPLTGLGRDLSPAARPLIALTRCLLDRPRLLVLDEPTAALGSAEVDLLMRVVERLTQTGSAVLFVSHRLEEVLAVANHITVMRNGRVVKRVAVGGQSRGSLVAMMSGEDAASASAGSDDADAGGDETSAMAAAPRGAAGEPLLRIDSLSSSDGRVNGVSLAVQRGEILGLYGLAGAGRTELLESIYGSRRRAAGHVTMAGRQIRGGVRAALAAGLRLVPEDRKRQALITHTSVAANLHLGQLRRFARAGGIQAAREVDDAVQAIRRFAIRTTGPAQAISNLSGGNQQKVVFARVIDSVVDPAHAVLLCDEPTQAVDVATRRAVHALIREHTANGGGALVASSDIEELLALSDRVIVLCEGRVAGRFDARPFSRQKILLSCFPAGGNLEQMP